MNNEASNKHRILVAPLDWGLGHATRCIPIINALIEAQVDVVVAGSGASLKLLQTEYPQLTHIELPGFQITYPSKGSMAWAMIKQSPKIIANIIKEHRLLDHLITKYNIDAVISDNRYGLWTKRVPSVFMTHQLRIQSPTARAFTEYTLEKIVSFFINKYNECWVPDYPGITNLSGRLAHDIKSNNKVFYLGNLSRFKRSGNIPEKTYDIAAIISGPEPQRSMLEVKLRKELKALPFKSIIIQGLPNLNAGITTEENLTIIPHLKGKDLEEIVNQSKLVISRSGYSTIMDIAATGGKALFIPTPGQTEQEYLAIYHQEIGNAMYVNQDEEINVDTIKNAHAFSGFYNYESSSELLSKRINSLLNKVKK